MLLASYNIYARAGIAIGQLSRGAEGNYTALAARARSRQMFLFASRAQYKELVCRRSSLPSFPPPSLSLSLSLSLSPLTKTTFSREEWKICLPPPPRATWTSI